MKTQVRTLIGICLLAFCGVSLAKKPIAKDKPLASFWAKNVTLRDSFATSEGSTEMTIWRSRLGGKFVAERTVSPEGKVTWTRESPVKGGQLSRLTGNAIAKDELHYVATDSGDFSDLFADAKRQAADIAAKKNRTVLVHLSEEIVSIAP